MNMVSHFLIIFGILANFLCAKSSPIDIETCMENDDCGIKSYGSFILNNETSGHIYEIKNGLMYNIVFYWDVIYKDFGITNKSSNKKNIAFVPSMSYRYIDSKIHDSHTVRLFINMDNQFEMVDRSIGHESKKLAPKKSHVCDYLFRLCYLNKKYQEEDNNNMGNNTITEINYDSRCTEYENACSQFFLKTEEDLCIDTCITTYYGHLLNDKEKISPNFNRINLVQCMIEHQKNFDSDPSYKGVYTNNIGVVKSQSNVPEIQRLETTVTILAVLFTVSLFPTIIIIFFCVREKYKEYYTYRKGTTISLDNTDNQVTSNFV